MQIQDEMMKYWLPVLFFGMTSLYGMDRYDPASFDYGYPPPASTPADCGKLFTSIDLNMLRTATEGQVFGTEYLEGEDIESIGGVKRLYFPTQYDYGFKFLIGYSLPGDQWAATTTWFWFNSKQKAFREDQGFGSSRKGGSFFVPGLNTISTVNDLTFPIVATGSWKLRLNQFDFEASRDFLVGPSYTMKPSIGIRLIKFTETIQYDSKANGIPETDYLLSNLEGSFLGCGPVVGFDNFVDLGCGLGAFLNTKLALLVAQQKQKQHLAARFDIDPLDLSSVHFRNDTVGLKAALDFAVGLEWRMPVNCDLQFLFVRLAFENHLIFKAIDYPYLNSDPLYLPSYHEQSRDFALFGFSLAFGFTI